MTRSTFSTVVSFCLLVLSLAVTAQKNISLPRSTPEKEGVSSQGIIDFLDAAAKSKHEFHSYMVVRHGKVIAEGWWNPYSASLKHTMYSVSKSFTATAVGFAVSEGKLRVTDKVIEFFPSALPENISPYLSALTVKDLLTMSAGQEPDPTRIIVSRDSNWAKGFLALPIIHQPGSTFLYNSLATYILSAIVQKVTGQRVIDYLQPRLFNPLGIQQIDWETDPKGINTGGWGLRLKTEDMAKFGQLFLQKGKWQGRQVLSKSWVEEASTVKIIQHPELPQQKKDSSDWEQGYCYQMWRCRNNAYRADGAFGQFIVIMPDQDAVVVITAESNDLQGELNLVWKHLLPAMQNGKLPVDNALLKKLRSKTESLQLPVAKKVAAPDRSGNVLNKTFMLEENEWNMKTIAFNCSGDSCTVDLKSDTANYSFRFSASAWVPAVTGKPGPYLLTSAKNNLKGLPAFKVAGAYRWENANQLALVLRYIESPHTEMMTCNFSGDTVSIAITNTASVSEKIVLKGKSK